jgi:hypothetical protein
MYLTTIITKCLTILIIKASGKTVMHDYKQRWLVYSHES